jgi:hypothetical protein
MMLNFPAISEFLVKSATNRTDVTPVRVASWVARHVRTDCLLAISEAISVNALQLAGYNSSTLCIRTLPGCSSTKDQPVATVCYIEVIYGPRRGT